MSNKPVVNQSLIHWRALHQNTTLTVITNEPKGFPPLVASSSGQDKQFHARVITFSACHPAAWQGTATLTACWESWWARVRGRWRRRRRESSASGSEGRSWRSAPAPRRCCLRSVSRWLRSNQRLSTQCVTSTLCCEYSTLTSWSPEHGDMCDMQDSQLHLFHTNSKAVSYAISAGHCHLCGGIEVFIVSVHSWTRWQFN